jgi:hypothetical protein
VLKEAEMYRSSFVTKPTIRRVLSITVFILVSWTMAGAYTVVLYGGKQLQIPDNFIVTSDAVVYGTGPSINVSVLLNSIDVVATEHANHESPGSLLGRIGAREPQQSTSTTTHKATRTITNRDLERYVRDRMTSDAQWEERSKASGGPSLEETRREAARRDAALDEFLEKKKLEAEANYWREREAELRTALLARMNANDNQSGQYWANGIVPSDGGSGLFDSGSSFGRSFRGRINQGSPCGFNPSASCLMSHPFSLFNQGGAFARRRPVFVAPRINGGARRGGVVSVSPRRRH